MTKTMKSNRSITPNGGKPPGWPDRLLQFWRKIVRSLVEDLVKPILNSPAVIGPGGTKVSLGGFVVIGVCLLIWRLKG